MCNHHLHYLFKQHDHDVYAGIMLELGGIIVHGATQDDVEKKLKKQSISYFNAFPKVHELANSGKPLNMRLQSLTGTPKAINPITVECPQNDKWFILQY